MGIFYTQRSNLFRLVTALSILVLCSAGRAQSLVLATQDEIPEVRAFVTGSFTESVRLESFGSTGEFSQPGGVFAAGHEIEFQVHVPPRYTSSKPAGLLVFVSPVEQFAMPDAWQAVLESRNLIWVSVNGSGNTMPRERRVAEALLAQAYIQRSYETDPGRIYIAGMSGGAQIAAVIAPRHPELFRGGIFLCGVNPWSETEASPWAENLPEAIGRMRQNRYLFLSGTEDFKLSAVARVYRQYQKADIEKVKLMVIDQMGHELPDAEHFGAALDFVENR